MYIIIINEHNCFYRTYVDVIDLTDEYYKSDSEISDLEQLPMISVSSERYIMFNEESII